MARARTEIFYGWRIVAVCFVTLFVSVGFSFYSFGPFFKSLASEFGSGRLGIGMAIATFGIVNALVGPVLGAALDTRSIRRLMTFGVFFLAIGFGTLSQVNSLFQLYLVLGSLVAVGAAMIGGLTASTLVANWFVARRGMALGIATMGVSLSGVLMAPAATWLIEELGWRNTFVLYGALTLVIVLPTVRLFVVDRPEDRGLAPDGEGLSTPAVQPTPAAAAETPTGTEPVALVPAVTGLPLRRPALSWTEPLRDRNFWVIGLFVSLGFCCSGALLTHIVPLATDLGFSPTAASLVISSIAGLGLFGKVLFGWISDRVDKRAAAWLAIALQICGVSFILRVESYPELLAGGSIFGLGMGGMLPIWGTLIGACFGRRSFGRVMGLMGPFMLPIQSVGVPLAGLIFDRFGSYRPAFLLFIGLYILAMAAIALLRLPQNEPGTAVTAPTYNRNGGREP